MALIDLVIFCSALFLIVVGLVFAASGFGVFVVGHLDGVILIVMGFTMFWGGWEMSGARSFSCATAAILNMFDAASTISFWSFEINPLVHIAGPAVFLVAKVVCSMSIMLYAKLHTTPHKGGMILTVFFGLIVVWNLAQHTLAYLGLRMIPHELCVYIIMAAISFVASVATLLLLYILYPLD